MGNFFGKLFGTRTKDLKDIQVIFSDIDGTLYNRQGTLREETRKLAIDLKNAGVEIILATGREHQVAEEAYEALGFAMPVISLDGGLVRESGNGRVLFSHTIGNAVFDQITEELKNYKADFTCVTPDGNFFSNELDLPSYLQHPSVVSQKVQMLPSDVLLLRVYITGNKSHIDSFKNLLFTKKIIDSRDISSYESRRESGKWFIEIKPQQATKGNAVRYILESKDLKLTQAAGIGDYRNDVELLKSCGYRVAMNDAVAEMREIADLITDKTSEEGGIEEFFELVLKAKRNALS